LRQVARLTSDAAYCTFLENYPMQIAGELAESGCQTAILSNEHCSSRLSTATEIAKLHEIIGRLAHEYRVIIYLRRQDDLVASHYSTAVRSGTSAEFNLPSEAGWLNYLDLLEMWAQVFGEENLAVRIFEPQQLKDGDLLSDLFSIVGFARQDELLRPEHQNRSFDVYTVEFLRRFNAPLSTNAEGGLDPVRGDIDKALAAITTRECFAAKRASGNRVPEPVRGIKRRSCAPVFESGRRNAIHKRAARHSAGAVAHLGRR